MISMVPVRSSKQRIASLIQSFLEIGPTGFISVGLTQFLYMPDDVIIKML